MSRENDSEGIAVIMGKIRAWNPTVYLIGCSLTLVIGLTIWFLSAATESSATEASLGQTFVAEDISLTLTNFDSDGLETMLDFEAELPDRIATQDGVVVPLSWWSSSTSFDNVEEHPQGNHTIAGSYQPGDETYQFTIVTGPVIDANSSVAVEFDRFSVVYQDREEQNVAANVRFEVSADVVSREREQTESQDVQKSASDSDISVVVDRVAKSPDEVVVDYTIESEREGQIIPVEQIAWLRHDSRMDGKHAPMIPTAREDVTLDSHSAIEVQSSFRDASGTDLIDGIMFDVGPFVRVDAYGSAEFTIEDPFGDWFAEPFAAHGDRFEVSDVEIRANEDTMDVFIQVANAEPIDQANVMLQGIDASAPVARTDDGSEHTAVSYGTGMQRDEDRMGAGASGFEFSGLDPDTEALSIQLLESSELLRGDWSVRLDQQ